MGKNISIPYIYEKYPTQLSCIRQLEEIRWNNNPQCPYCESHRHSLTKQPHRYHCNECHNTYSVLVGTLFHNTKIPLQKWFLMIALKVNAKLGKSARGIARDLGINKDTAWRISMKLREAMKTEIVGKLSGIFQCDETYVGGKNKNKHLNKRVKNSQGRSTKDKVVLFGFYEQNTHKTYLFLVPDTKRSTLMAIIEHYIEKGAMIYTDEYPAYNKLSESYIHKTVKHKEGQYTDGEVTTNGIENKWAIIKNAIRGAFIHLSKEYFTKYLDEFQYFMNQWFNYENNTTLLIFSDLVKRCITDPTYKKFCKLFKKHKIYDSEIFQYHLRNENPELEKHRAIIRYHKRNDPNYRFTLNRILPNWEQIEQTPDIYRFPYRYYIS